MRLKFKRKFYVSSILSVFSAENTIVNENEKSSKINLA